MRYYIYLIRNKINNKIYIGKRKCPINKTPITDPYMGSGKIIRDAIKKYGIENFEKEVLFDNIVDVKSLNILEIETIKKYSSTNKKIGYNRTIGGDGGNLIMFFNEQELKNYKNKLSNRTHTEETKQKLREKVNYDSIKKNLIKARKRHNELIKSGWRQTFTQETRKKMSDSRKGKKVKRVLCVETNIIYNSMQDAAKLTNSSISKISLCCNGKRNKTNNYHWKFI